MCEVTLAVIIPSRTLSNLMPCVDAVRQHEPGARVIVVDDGLDRTDKRYWQGCFELLGGVKPFIFARNCNIGIRAAGADDVVLLNDDALLRRPGGFALLQRAAADHPEYGLISATTNRAGNPDQKPRGMGLRDAGHKCVAFVCVFIPRRTIDRVGLLDERFVAYGFDDNDYCRRTREAGMKLGIHDGCYVDHESLRSTYRGDPRAGGDIAAGAAIYRAKWGSLD